MYQSGEITVVDGREYFSPGAKEELARLRSQRLVLWCKLGATQVFAGFVYEFHLNGTAYSFAPYAEWKDEFSKALSLDLLPTPTGPHVRRDHLLWWLWHFRHRARIEVGRAQHKVRGGLVECLGCGHRHRYVSRPRDEHGLSCCRKCGGRAHRAVPENIKLKPFGRISKAGLLRRFRVSKRRLDRILAFRLLG